MTDDNVIPGFKILNTSDHPDHESRRGKKIKPNPSMYREEVNTKDRTTQFENLELHFEFKVDTSSDPFMDPPANLPEDEKEAHEFVITGNSKKRKDCLGQLASYATEWCTRQHRMFAFSVFIGDPYVRFIRWDRSGAIVSEMFDYRKNGQPLVDFLWRFTHLSPVQRGIDESVRPANPDEAELAGKHLSEWKNTYARPVIVFQIQDGQQAREFIGWGSRADAESLTGRATRAYPVYEKSSNRILFLKDSWRAECLEKESDILKTLNDAGVRNVPNLVCGGDIEGHETLTNRYASGPLSCESDFGNSVERIHHRFVSDFVGKHISGFTSTKEMVQAIRDAYIAHQDAYELCGILHRDVSGKNVLMGLNCGVLNDWDLAKRMDSDHGPRPHERTGTWPFISTLLLKRPGKAHWLQDDIESFVLVVLYHGLRYANHNKIDKLHYIISRVFDDSYEVNGTVMGGDGKRSMFLINGYLSRDFAFTGNPALTQWKQSAFKAIAQWIVHAEQKLRENQIFNPSVGLGEEYALRDHKELARAFEIALSS